MNKLFNKDNFLCGAIFVLVVISMISALIIFEYLKISLYVGPIKAWDYMYGLDIKSLIPISKTLLAIFGIGILWGYIATKYDNQVRVFWLSYIALVLLFLIYNNNNILTNPLGTFALAKMFLQMYTFAFIKTILLDLATKMVFLLLASFCCHKYVLKKDEKAFQEYLAKRNAEKLDNANQG